MTVKISQKRSIIKKNYIQKRTMIALGLGKMNKVVEHEMSPSIQGMIDKVKHLVTIKASNSSEEKKDANKEQLKPASVST